MADTPPGCRCTSRANKWYRRARWLGPAFVACKVMKGMLGI